MKTLKAVRYLRVSSEHQVEGMPLRTRSTTSPRRNGKLNSLAPSRMPDTVLVFC